jgi:hypothetical protein
VGVTTPAAAWYFAEGFTGDGFEEYLDLLNPGAGDASVTLTYVINGVGPIVRTVVVGARRRASVAVHEPTSAGNPGGLGRLLSGHATMVLSTIPIVAERRMYFRYASPSGEVTGGSRTFGATFLTTTWYFAGGETIAGHEAYLTLFNPGATTLDVTLTYYLTGAGPVLKALVLPPTSRTTIAVQDVAFGVGAGQTVGVGVAASGPIVAERLTFFTAPPAPTP